MEIPFQNGILTVVSPVEDTPAFRAGLQPRDEILKIDGKPTKGMTLFDAVKAMRGPKGTQVKLAISRAGKEKDVTISKT